MQLKIKMFKIESKILLSFIVVILSIPFFVVSLPGKLFIHFAECILDSAKQDVVNNGGGINGEEPAEE